MNLKLTNEVRSSVNLLHKDPESTVKEERKRNGRYIAILVGICLLILAMYHAWVRRIPVVASLVVPALIMFVYVGWVLFTAKRDKRKFLDAEAALNAVAQENAENENQSIELSRSNMEISETSKESSKINSPDDWSKTSSVLRKGGTRTEEKSVCFIKPIILVNDKLPEDLDQKWTNLVQTITYDKQKEEPRRKFKRKYCRRRRHAAFKRSYSIG